MGRRRNSKCRTGRHSRRRNADKFLSPFRFALRMSRRTEIGSRGHSISGAPPRKYLQQLVANWIPRAARDTRFAIYRGCGKRTLTKRAAKKRAARNGRWSLFLSFRAKRGISLRFLPAKRKRDSSLRSE